MSIKSELEALIGRRTEKRQIRYGWRELALYALSVGATEKDLGYVYEKEIKALPSFGVLPYWAAAGVEPAMTLPAPASMFAMDILRPEKAFLNMTHEIILHQPIPVSGVFTYDDAVTNIYDRGEGKGVVLETCNDVYGADGTLLCTNIGTTYFYEGGGYGGDPMPKSDVVIPDREPDITAEDFVSPTANLLYRLTGDTNLIHVDPEYAKDKGLKQPIVQGLCSLGYACRLAIDALIPGEPERVSRMSVQMTGMLLPGTPVELHLWRMTEGKAVFRFIDKNTGTVILNRGVFEWK